MKVTEAVIEVGKIALQNRQISKIQTTDINEKPIPSRYRRSTLNLSVEKSLPYLHLLSSNVHMSSGELIYVPGLV